MPVPEFAPMLAGYGPPGSVEGCTPTKLDGCRAALNVGESVTVRTRDGHVLELPELSPVSRLGLRLVLDGELVGGAGRMSDFHAVAPTILQRRRTRRASLSFAAFDMLWIDGT